MPAKPSFPHSHVLRVYFTLLFVASGTAIAAFWPFAAIDTWGARLYAGTATLAYAALYTSVPVLLTLVSTYLLRPDTSAAPWRWRLIYGIAWLGATLVLLCLYADYRLYELYEFHFNGFVWNLITTPGGIAALGATDSAMQSIALQVTLLCGATGVALWMLHRHRGTRTNVSRRILLGSTTLLLFGLIVEEGTYAYSTHTGQEEILQAAEVVPFHIHASATKLFKYFGIQRTAMSSLRIAGGQPDYPPASIASTPLAKYPNILMLVGESFRWDLLDPEITPNLWRLAGHSLRFDKHYSGGNRTRMGLFSMFYGLHAPYWYSFERERVAPLLMRFLQQKNYQLALHTSQSFDYPELRHTLFTGIDERYLQEIKTGEPWLRDRQNISDLIEKLGKRDLARPFFGFMFFESTHAPYTFPEEGTVRQDYIRDFNYLKANLQEDIDKIHARYINAAHHVDREAGRLMDYLEKNGMLDNTIVLFTGDHGEEFMENGHWGHGHNRSLPEQQVRVPLILHLPGQQPAVISHRTSHLQIAPTLLEQLGVTETSAHYSSAPSLQQKMPYFVAGDYDYMTVFDEHFKITFPFTGSDYLRYTVHDGQDKPVSRQQRSEVMAAYQDRIDEVIKESRRFQH